MSVVHETRDRLLPRIIGISPLERPDVGLVAALGVAGALGVLDLGRDRTSAARALAMSGGRVLAVRIPDGVDPDELPARVRVILCEPSAVARWAGSRRVLAQVTSLDEARLAIAAGAYGLIAKGSEAGGRIGDETTFVLLQRTRSSSLCRDLLPAGSAAEGRRGWIAVPVWAQGGIGEHTAAACIAGGAAGVVLDTQLALVRESTLAPSTCAPRVASMDGSETTVIAGHRLYTRPDLPVAHLGELEVAGVRARLGGDDLSRSLPADRPGPALLQHARARRQISHCGTAGPRTVGRDRGAARARRRSYRPCSAPGSPFRGGARPALSDRPGSRCRASAI